MVIYPRTSSTRAKEGKEVVSVVEIWIGWMAWDFVLMTGAFAKQITCVMCHTSRIDEILSPTITTTLGPM